MPTDDEAARKARAKQLHRQIEQIVSPENKEGKAEDEASRPEPSRKESPGDFIHRRMRELDQKQGK